MCKINSLEKQNLMYYYKVKEQRLESVTSEAGNMILMIGSSMKKVTQYQIKRKMRKLLTHIYFEQILVYESRNKKRETNTFLR